MDLQTNQDRRIPSTTAEEFTRVNETDLAAGRVVARVAMIAESALSVGVSQREDARCVTAARRLGLPVHRRCSGGLGVWHEYGDIVWSLVLPRGHPRVGRDFSKAYGRLGAAPVRVLRDLGVSGAWGPAAGLPGECCLLSGNGPVLTVSGRAIGGAAQHVTRAALLHHGVLPYRLDPHRLQELFGLSPELVDRTLAGWERITDGESSAALAERLRAALHSEVGAGAG